MTERDRERIWADLLARARATTDCVGTPIDEGILETVVGLWAHDFKTHSSCAGHEDQWPFVHIAVISDEDMETLGDDGIDASPPLNEYARAALVEQERVLALLAAFYRDRRASQAATIVAADRPSGYGFSLQSQGGPLVWLREGTGREGLVSELRDEMTAFGRFLRERYMAGAPAPDREWARGSSPCFVGRFRAGIDEDRCVPIPREFLAELAVARAGLALVLIAGAFEAVSLVTAKRFEPWRSVFSEDPQRKAWDLAVDENGGVVLPAEILERLGPEVDFTGVEDRIELWPVGALEKPRRRASRSSSRPADLDR